MRILLKPVITEKASEQMESSAKYTFLVDRNANKIQIKSAVEQMYDVSVEKVRTMNYAGKAKSRHTKSGLILGKTKAVKKAIVDLVQGESIDFYSNI